jgi:cysteine-rich repeat protein
VKFISRIFLYALLFGGLGTLFSTSKLTPVQAQTPTPAPLCSDGQLVISSACTNVASHIGLIGQPMPCPGNTVAIGVGRNSPQGNAATPLILTCCPATYNNVPLVRSTCVDKPYAFNTDAVCDPGQLVSGVKFPGGTFDTATFYNPASVTCCNYTVNGVPLTMTGTTSNKVTSNVFMTTCNQGQIAVGMGDTNVPDRDVDKLICLGNLQCSAGPTATPTPPPSVCGNGQLEGNEECDDGNTNSLDTCLSDCQLNDQCRLINFDSGTIQQILTANGITTPHTSAGIKNLGTTTIFDNPLTGGPVSAPNGMCNTASGCTTGFTLNFSRRPYYVSYYALALAGTGNITSGTNVGAHVTYNDGLNTQIYPNPANQHFHKHILRHDKISSVTMTVNTGGTDAMDDFVYCQEPVGCGDDIIDSGEQCDDGNADSGDGCSATCQTEVCQVPYDLLILIDSTNSVKEYGLGDEVRTATNAIIDSFDFSRNRLSIAAHAGWSMYLNTGFTTDKNVLKARVNTFTTQNYNLCYPGNVCFGQFDDAIRNFFTTNTRPYSGGGNVPQYVVLFNDGDIYQIPSAIPNTNYNLAPYNNRTATGYGTLSPYISQWQAFLNEYSVFWIRFMDGYTMLHPNYTAAGNTVKDSSFRQDIALTQLTNNPNALLDAFQDTFSQACEVVTPIICGDGVVKSPEEECDDGNTTNGDGCSASCNLTTQCSDGLDNDQDGRTDCDPVSPDLGCFPDGLGNSGPCNPNDDNEQDDVNACTGACVEDRHCEAGNTCIAGECIATQCAISGVNCDPNRCLAICPSVTLSSAEPVHGETIQFTCTAVPGTERYVFKIKAPESGEITTLESIGSNISPSYTIDEYGDYKLQCQLCTGLTDDTCLAFEEM